jgi:hypothetical protein
MLAAARLRAECRSCFGLRLRFALDGSWGDKTDFEAHFYDCPNCITPLAMTRYLRTNSKAELEENISIHVVDCNPVRSRPSHNSILILG